MSLEKAEFFMSPAEDAALLLRIVRRHLQAMKLNMEAAYPDEEWGFLAQQVVEKVLKARIVLNDQEPRRVHELGPLAMDAGIQLPPDLLALQVFAVEARYEEGPFELPASRQTLLDKLEEMLSSMEASIERLG
jgi:HEPN domain-containing protein